MYITLSKCDYIKKVNGMIEDGIIRRKYVETIDNAYTELKPFQYFFAVTFTNMKFTKRCFRDLVSPFKSLQQVRRTNLNLSMALL